MTLRNLLLLIHIAGVAAWLGATVVQLVLARRFDRASPEVSKAWTEATIALGERYYTAAGVVILATGVGLVLETPFSWGDGFIWVGVAAVIAGAVMGGTIFGPLSKKRVAAIESGDTATAERALASIIPAAYVDCAIVLVAIMAMVSKWFV